MVSRRRGTMMRGPPRRTNTKPSSDHTIDQDFKSFRIIAHSMSAPVRFSEKMILRSNDTFCCTSMMITLLLMMLLMSNCVSTVRGDDVDDDDSQVDPTLRAYLRVVKQLEQDVNRRRSQESKAETKITTVQADAARAAIATLDAQLLHARSLVQLATFGDSLDQVEVFFEPPVACERRCAYVCDQLVESQIECLQVARNCLRQCRQSRNTYRPANVTERSLAPRLQTLAEMRVAPLEAHFHGDLAAQVRELIAQRLKPLSKRSARHSGAIRVRMPAGAKAAAVMECPIAFEVVNDAASMVDIALLAAHDSTQECSNAGVCVAVWNNRSESENTALLLATEAWPLTCADVPADKIPVPAWRSAAAPLERESWLKPSRTRRHTVFIACDGCDDAGRLLEMSEHVQLMSDAPCTCDGADESQRIALERAVDVSRSNRAADSAFFALFGTHHLLAAFASGAVPIVFGAGLDMGALPSRSVLLAGDFERGDTLARFVVLVSHDEAYYRSFHQWRTDAAALRQIYSLFRFAAVSTACRMALVAAFGTDADPLSDDDAWLAFCESARV